LHGENPGPIEPEFFPAERYKIPAYENRRREKNKPRHDPAEHGLWGDKKQNAAQEPAHKTNRRENRHIYAGIGRRDGETVARGVARRDLAREQRDSARRIGINGRQSGGDERRESEKRAAASYSIDKARSESRESHYDSNHDAAYVSGVLSRIAVSRFSRGGVTAQRSACRGIAGKPLARPLLQRRIPSGEIKYRLPEKDHAEMSGIIVVEQMFRKK